MDSDTFTPEEELDAHLATMKWLEEQRINGHEILTFQTLNDGFRWHGHRIQLINRNQGIWRPKQFRGAFSFKTTSTEEDSRPYDDTIDDDGLLHYQFTDSDNKAWTNNAMIEAHLRKYPLVWLIRVPSMKNPTLYYMRFPAYIKDVNLQNREFIIDIDDWIPSGNLTTPPPIEKKYKSRWMKERIHQHDFREHVLSAYQISCAVCDLPHAQLLEASHIIADSRETGAPEVSNGLALCRLHHTAYDRHLLGIDADRRIHVATRAKRIETIHLQTGLLPFEGRSLTHVPAAKQMRPDGDRLAEHFKEFLQTEEQTVG